MFRGANTVNMDGKGRLVFPTKYREQLSAHCGNELIATIDLVLPCLLLFPIPEWEKLEHELMALSNTNTIHARIKRILLSHATDVELDKSGRLLIPGMLRNHASLDKQVVLAGQGRTFQLWDAESWHAQIKADIEAHQVDLEKEDLPDLSF
ncbi:MAG: division/cell wall cluster transcriptional repressor MraZ [Pseudomonadota bacterium]